MSIDLWLCQACLNSDQIIETFCPFLFSSISTVQRLMIEGGAIKIKAPHASPETKCQHLVHLYPGNDWMHFGEKDDHLQYFLPRQHWHWFYTVMGGLVLILIGQLILLCKLFLYLLLHRRVILDAAGFEDSPGTIVIPSTGSITAKQIGTTAFWVEALKIFWVQVLHQGSSSRTVLVRWWGHSY